MMKYIIFLIVISTVSCSSIEKKRFENANVYINSHLDLTELNRIAILEGMVILGMNPCESIAAIGEPYDFEVKKSAGSPGEAGPWDIVLRQCKNPDKNIVILYFNNSFQYAKKENYSVTYINGAAVRIQRGAVKGGDWEVPDKLH